MIVRFWRSIVCYGRIFDFFILALFANSYYFVWLKACITFAGLSTLSIGLVSSFNPLKNLEASGKDGLSTPINELREGWRKKRSGVSIGFLMRELERHIREMGFGYIHFISTISCQEPGQASTRIASFLFLCRVGFNCSRIHRWTQDKPFGCSQFEEGRNHFMSSIFSLYHSSLPFI